MSWYIATESVWGFFFCPLLNIAQSLYFKIGLTIFSRIHRASLQQRFITFFSGLQTVTTFPGGYYIHRCWNSFSILSSSPSKLSLSFFCLFIFVSVGGGDLTLDPISLVHLGAERIDVRRQQRSARDRKRELFRFHLHRNCCSPRTISPGHIERDTHRQTDKRIPKSELGIRMRSRGVWTERKRLF